MSCSIYTRILILWTALRSDNVLGAPLSGDAVYKHWVDRQDALNIITSHGHPLSKNEVILDRYLSYLKQIEIWKDHLTQPIEESLDTILQSDLFRILKLMPKGGNMHVHENHLLSRKVLLDLIWDSGDFPHLYILSEDHPTRPLEMDFFIDPPPNEPWERVEGHPLYTRDFLLGRLNLVDVIKTEKLSSFDTRRRWKASNHMWGVFGKVIANVNVKVKYIEAMVQTSLQEGVQYLELKKSFGTKEKLYELDNDPKYKITQGKKFMEEVAGMAEIPLVKDILDKFKLGNPYGVVRVRFSGMKRLVQSVRHYLKERVLEDVLRSIELHKAHPDHIAGFDLAGEEDTGHSNFYHAESLLKAARHSMETNNSYRVVSHAGETSYDGDIRFRPNDDTQTASTSNVLDAILLNSSRIGHGLSIARHPELLAIVKKRDVAIEVCPACNHILGFVPDTRSHPAATFHKAGIPIVLGSDAHGIFGFEYFTVDWYLVFVAWNIGLGDLKKFARQSLAYSSMNETEKEKAIADWQIAWEAYVTSVVSAVCPSDTNDRSNSFQTNEAPVVSELIPREVPLWTLERNSTVDIHLYGGDFSAGICKEILCRSDLGNPLAAAYVTSQHLVCRLPTSTIQEITQGQSQQEQSFRLFVAFDGEQFIMVNQSIHIALH